MEIRSTLYKFLLDHHKEFASFIRNKLVKLVVDIGRLDWPHFYPDFFANNLHVRLSFDVHLNLSFVPDADVPDFSLCGS